MSFPSDEPKPAAQIELQHFLHEHLLVYNKYGAFKRCNLCRGLIYPYSYSCEQRCKFYLHELCAELPRYIRNSLHPMHDLHLAPVDVENLETECSLCEKLLDTFGYNCSACDFNLHMECTTVSIFDPKDHEHAFINFKPTLFTCDACGIDEQRTKCFSCICSTCSLQVHGKCRHMFPLPPIIRQRMHNHELKLCYSFEIGFDFANKLCKICSKKMNDVLCLYQCKDGCTSYIAHATCATSSDFLIDHKETAHNTSDEDEDEDEHKEIDIQQEHVIKHFSHPHALVLNNIQPEDDDDDDDDDVVIPVCYGCVRPVSAPFYTCTRGEQCNFFLHKQCYELPKTIISPIHRHPLALKDFPELLMADILIRGFTCHACQVQCNGFVYMCSICYDISDAECTFDVECTLLGDTLQHASHKCQLALVSTIPNEENRCVGCGSTFSTAFWCEECNFFIDLKCASLPRTIGHDCPTGTVWSIKPRKLRYDCIEHAGGQYYCDLCEETRGKDLWFYYCDDCRECVHPQCLLGDNKVTYGKSYVIDGHCHPIRVAKKPKTNPLCDTCGKACQQSPLAFCPTCNVYMHDDPGCCVISSSSRSKPINNYCSGTSSNPDVNEDSDGNRDGDDDENDPEISLGSDISIGQVNHFSHPHGLIIGEYDKEQLLYKVCAGCVMPISAPFYICADKDGECNFFLHVECFELPKQIQHPLHLDHPLVLDLPEAEEVGFICYGCDAFSNGFVYTCLACKFFLDVRCSLLSDTLVHETHPCTLTLADKNTQRAEGERKCNLCETDCCSCLYSCDECSFALHLRCASLPKTVLHVCSENNWETHPQYLIAAAATEDDQYGSRDEKCEVCGDSIGGNRWYYSCEDCDEATHSRCSSFSFRKGVVYQAYNHFHNLVTSMAIYNKDCAVCYARMEVGPALYCDNCDVYLHIKCCRRLQRA